MMKRRSRITSPLPALVALLFLLLACFFNCAAAARLLHAAPPPALVHQQENNGVKAGAAEGLVVLQEGAAVNGNDHSVAVSVSEMTGAEGEEEEEPACEEGNDDDECLQRRLLRDAHLDYIYTQHKGKP